MTDDTPARPAAEGSEGQLDAVDALLNVFALANSMDLHRDHLDPPDRVLVWFRDGLERRIHLRPAAGGSIAMELAAGEWGAREPGLRVAFDDPMAPSEIKARLPDAVDAANGLTLPDS